MKRWFVLVALAVIGTVIAIEWVAWLVFEVVASGQSTWHAVGFFQRLPVTLGYLFLLWRILARTGIEFAPGQPVAPVIEDVEDPALALARRRGYMDDWEPRASGDSPAP